MSILVILLRKAASSKVLIFGITLGYLPQVFQAVTISLKVFQLLQTVSLFVQSRNKSNLTMQSSIDG